VTSIQTTAFVVREKRHLFLTLDKRFDFLGYQYGSNGQFNWTRALASAASQQGANPAVDHSTQTDDGYYMLAEGKVRNANDRAVLLTPMQDRSSGSCLHFWYYLRALPLQMRLSVYLSSSNPILWSEAASLSTQWSYAQVSVRNSNDPWQAVFEAAVSTANADGSVAIDDVSITRGLCPNPGDCTFEVDLCGWTNDENVGEMYWLIGQGIHSFGTGPQYGMRKIALSEKSILLACLFLDHTTNTAQGKYLMIETSLPTKPGDRARLQSEVFDGTNGDPRCFRFWYHM
jgi:hypothetical protein